MRWASVCLWPPRLVSRVNSFSFRAIHYTGKLTSIHIAVDIFVHLFFIVGKCGCMGLMQYNDMVWCWWFSFSCLQGKHLALKSLNRLTTDCYMWCWFCNIDNLIRYNVMGHMDMDLCEFSISTSIHFSWAGIKAGHLGSDSLLGSITAPCRKQFGETDVLVIDEISMISSNTLPRPQNFLCHITGVSVYAFYSCMLVGKQSIATDHFA